jgi:hypothetical protein
MKSTTTRAPRRNAEQIARDELAMTEKKLDLVNARLERLREETRKADYEASSLARLLVYQAAHPLLQQLEIIGDPQ